MTQDEAIKEAITTLYFMSVQVTTFEASHLESWQEYGCKTPLQRVKLAKLVTKYLQNDLLAAEILGQERLW